MKDADAQAFLEFMSAIYDYYSKPEPSEATIELYWLSLSDYEYVDVQRAVTQHMRDSSRGQFLPRVADIVRQIDGEPGDIADSAWMKVYHSARKVGAYESVVFDDPKIHHVVSAMGGWLRFCHCDLKEEPFIAKEFCNRYKALGNRENFAYPPRIIGIFEAENAMNGYPVEPPRLVGDTAKCLTVQRGGKEGEMLKITQVVGDSLKLRSSNDSVLEDTTKTGRG